jgi:hypothetical protein
MRQTKIISGGFILFLFAVILMNCGCATTLIRGMHDPHLINSYSSAKNVKVHMKDGSLFMLDSLITYETSDTIEGYGIYYDKYRDIVKFNIHKSGIVIDSVFKIALPDVALLEVNSIKNLRGKAIAMTLISVASLGLTTYCLINPKACFGSCPTFYTWDGNDTTLMAEGFSSSILSIYEKDDIDMLWSACPTEKIFSLRLTNEALETHTIRSANILLLPREDDSRVFATEAGDFFQTSHIQSPAQCTAPEGDCLEKVIAMDKTERYSESDRNNLISKEIIEVTFDNVPEGDLGFIIGCRQTLMTTYLFYQGLAYLGSSAGYFASRIESGDKSLQKKVDRVRQLLGGIELFIRNSDGKWVKLNEIAENGPIASDIHLIRLPRTDSKELNMRLRLTKGLWRINYLALGTLVKQVNPVIIEPSLVLSEKGNTTNPECLLRDPQNPLVTLPGDVYDLYYSFPDFPDNYEIFLKSRGYYIEWMREPWLREENHLKAALFFGMPWLFMKMAADDFKKTEPVMEESFWNSRYVRKN